MISTVPLPALLPATFSQAALRGLKGKCPRCGEGGLFRKFLKPVDTCPACQQDWSIQQADDFPAYVAIIVTGHLLAPIMIASIVEWELSPTAALAIIMPLAVVMMVGMLQPAKGAIIATQWWHGLHGFVRERAPDLAEVAPDSAA